MSYECDNDNHEIGCQCPGVPNPLVVATRKLAEIRAIAANDGIGGMSVSSPTQTCQVCGDVEVVCPDGRGFPPEVAKRKLAKRCTAKGHVCKPQYRAGYLEGRRPHGMAEDWAHGAGTVV